MVENYELNGNLNVYAGDDLIIENLSQAMARDLTPRITTVKNELVPALCVGVIPTTSGNLATGITARQVTGSTDVALAVYPLQNPNPINSILNPIATQVYFSTQSDTAIYTVPSLRRAFITGFSMNNYSDVTSDNGNANIKITPKGLPQCYLFNRYKPITTVDNFTTSIMFATPMELDALSIVKFTATFTVGMTKTSIVIYGYETNL